MTISQLLEAYKNKTVSAEETVSDYLKRIQKFDVKINAYITINDKAIDQAKKIDQKRAKGEKLGRLAGIPLAIKDMFCTKGLRTTAASKILENFIPPYSSTVTERLENEDAIILGKTNQDEFAMGSSNENSFFGPTRNPWNLDFVPGGSSGGSAAAVSANMAIAAMGTDTGGSVRQPASFCGLVGVKPTYSRVSRFGIISYASSLDQAGPMCRSVKDAALLLEIIAGKDDRDSTTAGLSSEAWSEKLNLGVAGKTIGLPREFWQDALDPEVRAAGEKAIGILQAAGAKLKEVSLPTIKLSIPVYYLIATSEASSNLARYDGVRFGYRSEMKNERDLGALYGRSRGEGFGEEVKRRIILGTHALSSGYYDAYYLKACQVRRLIHDDFLKSFLECDILLSPVTAGLPFKIGEKTADPLSMYLNDIFTTSANLAGVPAISVPIEIAKNGLPIGMQLIARHFDETSLFAAAECLEKAIAFQKWEPNGLR